MINLLIGLTGFLMFSSWLLLTFNENLMWPDPDDKSVVIEGAVLIGSSLLFILLGSLR